MPTVTNFSRYLSSHLDPARQPYPVMARRPLGTTGLVVGEVGLGASALESDGLAAVPDEEASFLIGIALDMQSSLLDVACSGGEDRALGLLASAMRGRRGLATVCLRVPGGPEELRRNTEKALRVLGTDHVDVLLWDGPRAADLGRAAAWGALADAKRAGKALCCGVSVESPGELRAAVRSTPSEVLRFPLNVFNQANAAVLDEAAAKGLGLIACRPLDSGWLTGRFGARHLFVDSRRRWSGEDKARRAGLQKAFEGLAVASGTMAAQAALSFVLSHPALSCVAPSASAWQQVVGNADAGSLKLQPAVLDGIRALWDRNLSQDPLVP